jgi:predicted pyridoxine 5'-phosphate oxidase superfamily flavin-nucleotide-binding protein
MLANARFNDVVTLEEQFRAVMGNPMPPVIKKEISYLDANCRAFIAKCPFVLISSCDKEGRMDISPKGDPPGFVQVLDERTLAIPDRPGNRRGDTFKNILQNDRVGLFFLQESKKPCESAVAQ